MPEKPKQPAYRCPHCGERVPPRLEDHARYICPRCRTRYRIMLDAETRAAVFVDESERPRPEPLGLPKGSIRALIALVMTATCAALVAQGRDVPPALISLLLAIIAFYFGFRTKAASLSDRVYDPTVRREHPLYLPAGVIRMLMIAALAVTAGLLVHQERLATNAEYVQFFVIIAGLVAGYFFGRVFGASGDVATRTAVAHVKGVFGLLVAAAVVGVFLAEAEDELPASAVSILCAAVSFYFGSRS
jgi:hypothetical protein